MALDLCVLLTRRRVSTTAREVSTTAAICFFFSHTFPPNGLYASPIPRTRIHKKKNNTVFPFRRVAKRQNPFMAVYDTRGIRGLMYVKKKQTNNFIVIIILSSAVG